GSRLLKRAGKIIAWLHPHCNTQLLSSRFDPSTTAVATVGDQFSVAGGALASPRRSTGVARRWPRNQTLGCRHSWPAFPSRSLAFRWLCYCPTWLVCPSRTLAFRSLSH